MNSLRRASLMLSLSCAIAAMAVVAAPNEIKLPQETAKLRSSTLPGYVIALQKCAICHSADYINFQPPGMNQGQWTAEVAKMQHAFGAPISDDEVKTIGAYLAVAYGNAKPTDADVRAASNAPTAPTAAPANANAAVDVPALLNANACLGCHAVDKKIVGPAYHDVAAKYKGDAQAQTKLEASIRQGGMGKWGQMPMPPNAGLSDAQVKALAAFVLTQ